MLYTHIHVHVHILFHIHLHVTLPALPGALQSRKVPSAAATTPLGFNACVEELLGGFPKLKAITRIIVY